MRTATFLAIACICAFPMAAAAQTGACRTIAEAADRLACYDRLAPPAKQKPTLAPAPSAAHIPDPQSPSIDRLADENLKLNAKIKTICRGC
jgi:hypothetical protein